MTDFPNDLTASLNFPQPGKAMGDPRRSGSVVAGTQGMAVERWENEGGHFPALQSVAITPTDISSILNGPAATAALIEMRHAFLADFAAGRVGPSHNTFQHRSRVLRQAAEPCWDGQAWICN